MAAVTKVDAEKERERDDDARKIGVSLGLFTASMLPIGAAKLLDRG